MTALRASIALLAVSAVTVLMGGLLWNWCEQRALKGEPTPELRGLLRLGRLLCVDAGLLVAAALVCYIWSRVG